MHIYHKDIIIYYRSLGIVGKVCSSGESRKYNIPAGDVFWLPTDVLDSVWYEEMLPHLKQSLKM